MSVETANDRDTFLADFGVAATISGVSGTVTGIFETRFVEAIVSGVPVSGYKPTLFCASSDLTNVNDGAVVSIPGERKTFAVVDIQADGTGFSIVILEEH